MDNILIGVLAVSAVGFFLTLAYCEGMASYADRQDRLTEIRMRETVEGDGLRWRTRVEDGGLVRGRVVSRPPVLRNPANE